MTPENTLVPDSVRVSIAERLVPSLGFALAAISGIAGAALILNLFDRLLGDQTAGVATVLQGLGQIEVMVATILVFAAAAGVTGLAVIIARMFMTTKTASVSGVLLLIPGLLSLVPAAIIAYVTWMLASAITSKTTNFAITASTASTLCYASIAAGAIAILILLIFSFVPLKSRPGRKFSPLICFLLIEGAIVVLAGIFVALTSAAAAAMTSHG